MTNASHMCCCQDLSQNILRLQSMSDMDDYLQVPQHVVDGKSMPRSQCTYCSLLKSIVFTAYVEFLPRSWTQKGPSCSTIGVLLGP